MSAWILAGVAIKGTAIFAAAWLVTVALRRSSAASRHLVWTAAAAAVLALPWLSLGLPSWHIAAVDRILAPDTGLVFRVLATDRAPAVGTAVAGAPKSANPSVSASSRVNWKPVIAGVWAIGASAMLLQMLVAYASLWRKRRVARAFRDEGLSDALSQALALPHSVPVLEAERGAMPMNFGLLRPVVFLPADASAWTEDRLRVVLLHELAHVRRGDVATHLLARTALALHWWNPVAWFAWREFVKERERATDDLVLSAGARASEYASHLLEVARSFHSGPATAWAAVAMARGSQLEGRLVAILDSGVRRGAVRRFAPLAAAVLAVALVAPFAAIEAQERPRPATPEIDATIAAANSQKNHELVDRAASAYITLQRYDVAQTLLETSLKIRGEVSGERSGAYAAGLVKLGELFERRGQKKEAGEFYIRAIELGDRPEIAPALYHSGLAVLSKDPSVARNQLQRAVNLDPKGPKAGPAMTWLAMISANEPGGAYEAETFFQRALTVEEPDSLDAATTLELYSNFLRFQNRIVESEPMLAKAKTIRNVRASKPQADWAAPNFRVNNTSESGYWAKTWPKPAATPSGDALRVGNGVTAPSLLHKVEPAYSEEARAAKWQGTVLVYVEVQPNGTAQNIRVMRGLGLGLDEKAIEAIQLWRFRPGTKDGVPVTVQAQIEVNFRLQ